MCIKFTAIIPLILIMAACGGGGSKTLHLAGGDETEGQWRAEVRATLANPIAAQTACGVQGLSDEDAVTYLMGLGTPTGTIDQRSMIRAVQILKEECGRIHD